MYLCCLHFECWPSIFTYRYDVLDYYAEFVEAFCPLKSLLYSQ